VADNLMLLNVPAFIAVVAIYLIASYLSTRRWQLLISSDISTKKLFHLYMLGSFFNTCLPGIIGGDAVKIFYLGKTLKTTASRPVEGEADEDKATAPHTAHSLALASVFMDRYIGFAALLVIAATAFPFGLNEMKATPVKWVLPFIICSFVFMSLIIFKARIGERFRFVYGIYEHLSLYRSRRKVLAPCFAYSLAIQFLGFISVYILAKGLSIELTFLSILVFLPIIIVVSFIPISISGLGLREGAFVFLFGFAGVSADKAVTLSLLWFISTITAGLWGLVVYLRFKTLLGGEIKQ